MWLNFNQIYCKRFKMSNEPKFFFSRRDKTFNFFSIMVKKRLKGEEDVADDDDEGIKGPKKTKKNKKDLVSQEHQIKIVLLN